MEFIRENIVKIIIFIVVLIISIIVFTLIFGRGKIIRDKTYASMESTLLNAGIKYANANSKLIPKKEDETNKINLDTLINSKYIKQLSAIEDENIKCSGYVELLYKNKKNIYVPYLKCGKYYETKSLADYIIGKENVVVTGDGLYKNGSEYVFKGENPNNNLIVGNKLYRIMQVNENGEVRIISQNKIYNYIIWDDRYNTSKDSTVGINDYSKSRLKDSFKYFIDNNNYVENDENNYFSEQEMDKMVEHDICIGKRSSLNGAIDSSNECQTVESNQKLSLITVSDYARASIDPNCNSIFSKSCVNYNYLSQISGSIRTITATADNTYQVYSINEGVAQLSSAYISFRPNLVLYLDNISLYASGDGTSENPYKIR